MFKSALFIFFITTFLVYGQANPTAVFYNGNVYTLSVLSSDITVNQVDSGLLSFNVRKRGDINSVALYTVDSAGVQSPLYIKVNGRNVYLTTNVIKQDRQLGYAYSLLIPNNVYTYQNGVERMLSLDNFDSIIVRAFYNSHAYLDNTLDVNMRFVGYVAPKIEVLDVFLSSPNNTYAITLKYSGGENKNISFYYRDGYDSKVYNIIDPLIKYGQKNATSIIIKNTFNNNIGKEYIVKVYFRAENIDQYLFFNAFDENGATTTIPLQVILEAVYIDEPFVAAEVIEQPIVVASASTEIESSASDNNSTTSTVVVNLNTSTILDTARTGNNTENSTVVSRLDEPAQSTLNFAQPLFLIDSSDNILSDDIISVEKTESEVVVVVDNEALEKQQLTRQGFIDFPIKIIDSILEQTGTSVDVVFVLDVTASMDIALNSVKRYIDTILVNMYSNYNSVRVGFVLFRDFDDDFFVKSSGYMTDIYDIKRFVYSLEASGGGDLPEPVLDAIDYALADFSFEAESRQMFVITDAHIKESIYTTEKSVMERIKAYGINLKYFVLPVMK